MCLAFARGASMSPFFRYVDCHKLKYVAYLAANNYGCDNLILKQSCKTERYHYLRLYCINARVRLCS